jgi:hypothetical protein
MKRIAFLACAVVLGCSNTTNTAPSQLTFNRPVDIAFGCYGGLRITNGDPSNPQQPIVTSAQPIQSCETRSQQVPTGSPSPLPPGQEDLTGSGGGSAIPSVSWFGFILESVPGVVAVARWNTTFPPTTFTGADAIVLKADGLTPGTNAVSVGDSPIAIATDTVGCYVVTANSGSCDLSELDMTTALNSANGGAPGIRVNRLQVMNGSGQPVNAKPAAMVAEPPGGAIGVACPQTATGLAYVAYPSCHTVAGVDLSTGTIVEHIDFDATGIPTMFHDGNVTCLDECAGAPTTAGTRPVALDLQADPRSGRHRMAIGADNSNAVTVVELGTNPSDPTTFDRPQSLLQIPLQQDATGTLGVNQVSLSPQMGMGGIGGIIDDDTAPGGQSQFVYAVATDRSVRVADILNVNKECDTQVDPRLIFSNQNVGQLSCFPVGAATTPARRPLAKGPGIALPGASVPTSVTVFQSNTYAGDTQIPELPSTLIGYFGAITAADGQVFVFNVTDDEQADFVGEFVNNQTNSGTPIASPIPLDIAHQLRDAIPYRGSAAAQGSSFICDTEGPDPDATGGNEGGARTPAPPAQTIPTSPVGAPEFVSTAKVGELPSIRQVLCVGADENLPVSEMGFAAPIAVRDLEFPDIFGMAGDENWTLTWEGPLASATTLDSPNGPQVREAQINIDAVDLRIDDQTHPFCSTGVRPYDIVQLRGCNPINGNNDCPIGYECFVHPNSQVTDLGACMLIDEAPRLADACKEFLISLRRYTIGTATSGELVLLPRKHVLDTTPIDGCTSDAQCSALATYALQLTDLNNPVGDTAADTHAWSCAVDPARAPELDPSGAPMKRCIETCMQDSDCVTGNVCQAAAAAAPQAGYCMEGVIPPQACVNAPQRYEIDGSEAFIALGTHTGYPPNTIADASGNCVPDPNAHPFAIGRIPLRAPACDPTADPRTGLLPSGAFDANPCALTVQQTDLDPNYASLSTCQLSGATTVQVTRNAPGVRAHLPGETITLVDTTYPGDQSCIQDRKGSFVDAAYPLGNMPLVQPGFQITYRLTAGFTPLTLALGASLPVRVRTGPNQSIWVIDAGDFQSTVATSASTKGKVFRIDPAASSVGLTVTNTLE